MPLPNPLAQFRSFNYIFTFSCLNNQEVNFPDSFYKTGEVGKLGRIICRSGGGEAPNRVSTAYTSDFNPEGKFEYYINSVNFQVIMSYDKKAGGTNASTFEIEVIEPYSMGIFLQSCQLAAKESGHENYLEAPFLLTIEFIGYVDDLEAAQIENTTRHLPIKLSNVEMDVSSGGCKYKVEGYAWNEATLTDMNNLLKTDLSVAGSTVQELLQVGENSLQKYLNSRLKEMSAKEKKKSAPDEVAIVFPKDTSSSGAGVGDEDAGATANPRSSAGNFDVLKKLSVSRIDNTSLGQSEGDLNAIGSSKMGFDMTTPGSTKPIQDNAVYNKETGRYERGKISFDPKSRNYQFGQGTTITSAINEILTTSEYGKQNAESSSTDAAGFKDWFRLETQTYNLEPNDGNIGKGRTPRLLVYRVVPYKAHSSRFGAPTSGSAGFSTLRDMVAKEYNYIYTGANTEVIDFNINLQSGFFSTVYADQGLLNKSSAMNGQDAAGPRDLVENIPNNENFNIFESGLGIKQLGSLVDFVRGTGGLAGDDPRVLVARQFQAALLNSPADLLTVDLTIMGDPYFIADSGMGNFSNSGSGDFNITETGAVDYQNGEVDILLNFRTPIDINPMTGVMDFGNTQIVEGFSGLYQVMTVENKFDNGKFTQVLNLVRRSKQSSSEGGARGGGGDADAQEDGFYGDKDGGSATRNPKGPAATPKMESRTTSGSSTTSEIGDPNADSSFFP